MKLTALVATSHTVAATSARKEKTAALAAFFAALHEQGPPAHEIEAAVGLLTGAPRQGRIGVGWATVAALEVIPAASASLNVLDIDEMLTEVASIHGAGSTARRAERLADTLRRATADELEFCRMVLVGEVRQGALAGVVTDAVAKAAKVPLATMRRAVMLSGDLGDASCIALLDGQPGLEAVQLQVGRAVEPMLASTAASATEAIDAIRAMLPEKRPSEAQPVASVEWKLDGARVQVHRDRDRVTIYTRNLNDVTERLPGVASIVYSFDCESCVLDGEVMGLTADGEPLAFQDTMSSLADDHSPGGLVPSFFDLLFLDGVSMIDEPLSTRSDALTQLAPDHCVPSIRTSDPDAAEAHLQAALDAGHEGVMVKALNGAYEAGRRGKGWRKVKPVHTLDLVVLAAEWGHGRRQGWLSNLHLGARDASTGELVMVGKTFKGLTDELLAWQTEAFLASESHRSSTGHTVFVAPLHVVEIALDGAQVSTRYPGGVALRFARVRAYRADKEPEHADTLDAVRALLPAARRPSPTD